MDVSHFVYHSSVGHLGCFHFLAVSCCEYSCTSFVWNTCFQFSCICDYTPEADLLDHMGTLCDFWGIVKLFLQCLHYLTFLPAIYEGSNFCQHLWVSVFYYYYYVGHSGGWEVVISLWLWFVFPAFRITYQKLIWSYYSLLKTF